MTKTSDEHNAPGRPVLALSANTSWNIVNFRSRLVRELIGAGFRVVAIAPEDEHTPAIRDLGAEFEPIDINSSGTSPVGDFKLLLAYRRIFRRIRPDFFLGVTIKPNIYGSIAAHAAGAKVINNVSGLGPMFVRTTPLTLAISMLYRISFRRSSTVFFQNADDLRLLVDRGIVRAEQAELLPGSGIDLDHFRPVRAKTGPSDRFRFLLVSRLQWNKGVAEFVEAARRVRAVRPEAVFQILGFTGTNDRLAVPHERLDQWQTEGVIEYLGSSSDVRPALAQSDCVVLPSYREGLPRSLLEGSAMGKPIIATDVPGCRQAVDHGSTGLLCEPQSAESLASAMLAMLDRTAKERAEMGRSARRKMEREFCETRVVAKYLEALRSAAGDNGRVQPVA